MQTKRLSGPIIANSHLAQNLALRIPRKNIGLSGKARATDLKKSRLDLAAERREPRADSHFRIIASRTLIHPCACTIRLHKFGYICARKQSRAHTCKIGVSRGKVPGGREPPGSSGKPIRLTEQVTRRALIRASNCASMAACRAPTRLLRLRSPVPLGGDGARRLIFRRRCDRAISVANFRRRKSAFWIYAGHPATRS